LTGRPSIPETAVIEPRNRGVLDRPVKPGDDNLGCGHSTNYDPNDFVDLINQMVERLTQSR
jgi:hypothetical protein